MIVIVIVIIIVIITGPITPEPSTPLALPLAGGRRIYYTTYIICYALYTI